MSQDQDDIRKLLEAFCAGMHAWEARCYQRSRQVRKASMGIAEAVAIDESELRELFREHCVDWQSPKRGATFGKPADYNPDSLEIVETSLQGDHAEVRTREKYAGLSPTLYTYFLTRTDNGWRLEDKRKYIFEESGQRGETTL